MGQLSQPSLSGIVATHEYGGNKKCAAAARGVGTLSGQPDATANRRGDGTSRDCEPIGMMLVDTYGAALTGS